MRAATILVYIVCLHQCTKNTLKYVHTKSKCGHIFVMPYYFTQESFSRSARDKGWVDKMLLHLSGGKEEKKVNKAQCLLFLKSENINMKQFCRLSI